MARNTAVVTTVNKDGTISVIGEGYAPFGERAGHVHPENPASWRPDPKVDRVGLSSLLKEKAWSVELLDHAIAQFNHPKPVGRIATWQGSSEPQYSRSEIARWREALATDLRTLGFSIA